MAAVEQLKEAAGLSTETLLDMYYKMLQARAVSIRQRMLQRMGRGAMTFSGEGHEAAQVGSAYALEAGKDWVFPYYRDVGVVLALGMTLRDVLLGFFARAEDISSGGKNMPSHFSHPGLRIVSEGAPVATQIPHAVGAAFAAKLRGLDEVAITYFGDGATSTGDCHEAMNFAAVHRVPVIFVCEHNNYAISVHWSKQSAVENVAVRAQGYGMPGLTINGNDLMAVYRTTKEAVERARRGEGPTFIEAKTYRFVPHSSDDDDRRYRTREEVDEAMKKDPILLFQQQLEEHGLINKQIVEELQAKVNAEVEEATQSAEAAAPPALESALDHVYVEKED